ncbi:hypothetical protein E4U51_000768 [Claviceps purpurea]|nr:hypothetical protein E4U51_000768 [Claviceps purpurea]KAG6264841.1 hypothetical protein E4U49_001343 [Claviceps purpurea]
MSIDSKPEPPHPDDSDDSVDSPIEGDHNASAPASANTDTNTNNPLQDGQQPKRKGGRKPIYATSEERKQRNRQAQAAFRERRTEYIKQLEETIRVHESNLHNLQAAHRNAADECLMLRYKNSLLERILLEKGIDVHAELQAKTDSPNLGPAHVPQNLVQPPTIPRPIMNRQHHNRKSNANSAHKLEPAGFQVRKPATSPKNRPIASAHARSPTTVCSNFSPAPSDSISMRGSVSGFGRQHISSLTGASQGPRSSVLQAVTPRSSVACAGASFYPTPCFQNQADQMDHEYDNNSEMVDDSELETSGGSRGFNVAFTGDTTHTLLLSPTSTAPPHHEHGGQRTSISGQPFQPMTPSLLNNQDWDPFGLSASMAFPPQQFPFDQTSMR